MARAVCGAAGVEGGPSSNIIFGVKVQFRDETVNLKFSKTQFCSFTHCILLVFDIFGLFNKAVNLISRGPQILL